MHIWRSSLLASMHIYVEVIYIEVISFGIVAHDHFPSSPLLSVLQGVVLQHTLLKHWPTQAVHLQSVHIKRSKDPILQMIVIRLCSPHLDESSCSKFAADLTHLPKSADSSCMQLIVAFQSG